MKTMKRLTRSRELESEQNEVNERKKARLSDNSVSPKRKAGKSNSQPINSIEESNSIGGEANSEVNGDSTMTELDQVATRSLEPKTSTPIVHNGLVDSLSSKLHNSALPEPIIFSSPEATKNDESSEVPMTEQNGAKEQDGVEPDTVSVSASSDVSSKGDEKLDNGFREETTELKSVSQPAPHEAKCEVDLFLSSLLQAYELEGHADCVTAVAADGDIIISASLDTTIKLWDTHKKEELCNFQGHTGSVTCVVLLSSEQSSRLSGKMGYSDDTRILISGSTDCSIRLWSVHEGHELLSIYTYNGITSMDYMEDTNYIAVGTDGGKLELWDLGFSKILHSVLAHEGPVTGLKVEDGYIYTVSVDGKVKVWLYEDDELLAIYCRNRKTPSPSGELHPTKWKCVTSHENRLFLGDNTSDIKMLEWKAGRISMMRNQTRPDGAIDAVFAKNEILLSSSFDSHRCTGAINVWQLPSMTYICTMSGDIGKVNDIVLTEKEGILRVVSGGSKLVIWDYVSTSPPAAGKNDKYFCHEVDTLGEDTSSNVDNPSSSNCSSSAIVKSSQDVTDGPRHSWKCTFL